MAIKNRGLWGLIAILLISNIGSILYGLNHGHNAIIQQRKEYPLLARRIFDESPNDTLINFSPLRNSLNKKFNALEVPHSLYFEYLPTGTSFRQQSEDKLIAASLVKLPLVMNLYHTGELGKIDLDKNITITEDDLDPSFGELYKDGAGKQFTARELAKLALTKSDNTASRAINRSTQGIINSSEESLPWLDIDYDMKDGEAIINARSYSSILKCLYFACYINKDNSHEVLQYLTESEFDDRLTKDMPGDIKVAHKFGTFAPQGVYSDCGIVYVPKRNYILCIMVQDKEENVNQLISSTSKEVYEWVSSR